MGSFNHLKLSGQEILFYQNQVAYTRDQEAYRKLFFHFHPVLCKFSAGITKDMELAEEIVSDLMIKIWDMNERLAHVEKLTIYLFSATKNSSISHLAKKKLKQVVISEDIEQNFKDKGPDPENRLFLSEMERSIESAINELPSQCQLVYKLIREEGFSYREVTSILEISQNTIETHMRIALKRIKHALDGYLSGKS